MASIIGVETLQHTNGTTAATIDSGGFISKPVMSLAVVGRTSNWTTTGQAVPFDRVHIDKNNDYNSSTGIFTCPVDGVYELTISVMSANSDTTMDIILQKNGTDQDLMSPYAAATGGLYNRIAQTAYIECVTGDTLNFKVNTGSIYGGGANGRHSCATFRYIG